jgi:hypothetical protein
MNDKSTPNQMRILLKRMRGKDNSPIIESNTDKKNKHLTMRDMLKITRNLNEDVNEKKRENKKTVFDQTNEEQKFRNYFDDLNVNVKFVELEVYDDFIFWGGTINGIIQFVYKVTPQEATSGVEFNYLEDFTPDNPENEKIIEKIEDYYNIFYKYWRDNVLQ